MANSLSFRFIFFPDYYLGKNTGNKMNLKESEFAIIRKNSKIESSGSLSDAKIFLWDGFCPVHQRFTIGDITYLRKKYPSIKIIVHPECKEEIVDASDLSGSTEKIYNLIKESPAGSVWGIGTETTFVERLAEENTNKTILPLKSSVCKNMIKITLPKLARSLESIINYIEKDQKLLHEVRVNDKYKAGAKESLQRMIDIVEKR